MAEMTYKDRLKLELFPTIWCPGCGIGTIMMQLAMTLDEMGLNERNTIIVTGIGCTGRMGGYLKHEAVYTLHGRTLPVAEAIKTVRPEMNVIVVAGDGDTASIGGYHLIHSIRRNAPVTVLQACRRLPMMLPPRVATKASVSSLDKASDTIGTWTRGCQAVASPLTVSTAAR